MINVKNIGTRSISETNKITQILITVIKIIHNIGLFYFYYEKYPSLILKALLQLRFDLISSAMFH